MPRETITDIVGSYDVKVGWEPERDVQIGVTVADPTPLVNTLYGDQETLEAVGLNLKARFGIGVDDALSDEEKSEVMREIARTALSTLTECANDGAPYYGVWATLDRAGCNRVIRVLRRARDSAFGRDE